MSNATRARKLPWRGLLKLTGLGLMAWVLHLVDYDSLKESLRDADYGLLALFLAGSGLSLLLRGVRYHYFLGTQDIRLTMGRTLRIFTHSTFWSLVVPGRLGELSSAAYLSRQGVSLEKAGANIVIERMADVLLVVLCSLAGSLFFLPEVSPYLWGILAVGGGAVAGLALALRRDRTRRPWRFADRLHFDPLEMLRKVLLYRHKTFLLTTSALLWFYYASLFVLVARAFHLPLPVPKVLLCVFMSYLAAMIPVTFAGIGTRDAMLVYLFTRFGLASDKAVLFSSSFLLVYVWLVVVTGLLSLAWRVHPVEVEQRGVRAE